MTAAIRRVLVRELFALILIPAFWPAAPAAQHARRARPAVRRGERPRRQEGADAGRLRPRGSASDAAISDDGKWMTYTYAPNEGDDTLFVKQLDGDKLYTVPIGSAAGGGRGAAAAADSAAAGRRAVLRRFALGRLLRESAGARGPGRGGAGRGGGRGARGPRGGGAPRGGGTAGGGAGATGPQRGTSNC